MKRTLILILSIVCSVLSMNLIAQDSHDMLLATETDSVEVKLSTRDYLNLLMTPDPSTGAVINIHQDSLILGVIDKGV